MRQRNRALVQGIVQGVGFRPFVYQLASSLELSGWVRNDSQGVVIEVEGEETRLQEFVQRLTLEAPPLAQIRSLQVETITPQAATDFAILESAQVAQQSALIPPDMSMCADCTREVLTPTDRRFGYPFTNCTNCGPRFTIIEQIPYDRPNTTMRAFAMCPTCQGEYHSPTDRRFHAEPNACANCGPGLVLDGEEGPSGQLIERTAVLLHAGKIMALKGLGGFHLACDARNTQAVATLRTRKGRVAKPFAVMSADLEEARRICVMSPEEEQLLLAQERPIVLLQRREGSGLAEVAPGNRYVGVMLPYTPLHHLLLTQGPKTLVMTSGNLSEEPIVFSNEEALVRLGRIAEHFLTHDRDIHIGCDDSVIRPIGGQGMPIRRSRGYVPRPIELGFEAPPVLACGGEQKNTVCLLQGSSALMSQHIGDLDNAETLDYFSCCIDNLKHLFHVEHSIIAYDLHPDYLSTKYALRQKGCYVVGVQHHHAHIVSALVDSGIEGPVIGVAFDGTGYGLDGAIWGGEVLIADRRDFHRAAHLRYLPLPGGQAAMRRPGRMALSYLIAAFGEEEAFRLSAALMPNLPPAEAQAVCGQVRTGLNAPPTSSIGRLFDAISALLGICSEATYEGQPAVELEMAAAGLATVPPYRYRIEEGTDGLEIDMNPTVREMVTNRQTGVEREVIAGRFHTTVADLTVQVCRHLAEQTGLRQVALTGGVFQNALLLKLLLRELPKVRLEPIIHRQVPPNDGGLSLGQAVVAALRSARACV